MHECGQEVCVGAEVYGKSVYLLLNYVVELLKTSLNKKQKAKGPLKQLTKKKNGQEFAGFKPFSHDWLHTMIRKAQDLGIFLDYSFSFSSILRGPHDLKIIKNN